MMYNKRMKKLVFLFSLCLFLTACASTGSNKKSAAEPEIPQLFADWQYRGFGQEYPFWAESVLNNDYESLVQFFPELEGKLEEIQVAVQFGQNVDMFSQYEISDEDQKVLGETWVFIDPYYESYEESYAYIKLWQEK